MILTHVKVLCSYGARVMLWTPKGTLVPFTDITDLMLSIHQSELLTYVLASRLMVKIIKTGDGFVGLTIRFRGGKLKKMISPKYGSKKSGGTSRDDLLKKKCCFFPQGKILQT